MTSTPRKVGNGGGGIPRFRGCAGRRTDRGSGHRQLTPPPVGHGQVRRQRSPPFEGSARRRPFRLSWPPQRSQRLAASLSAPRGTDLPPRGPRLRQRQSFVSVLFAAAIVAALWSRQQSHSRLGFAVGALSSALIATSPLPQVFATIVMLDVPGAMLLLLAVGFYLLSLEPGRARGFTLACVSSTALFFLQVQLRSDVDPANDGQRSAASPRTVWPSVFGIGEAPGSGSKATVAGDSGRWTGGHSDHRDCRAVAVFGQRQGGEHQLRGTPSLRPLRGDPRRMASPAATQPPYSQTTARTTRLSRSLDTHLHRLPGRPVDGGAVTRHQLRELPRQPLHRVPGPEPRGPPLLSPNLRWRILTIAGCRGRGAVVGWLCPPSAARYRRGRPGFGARPPVLDHRRDCPSLQAAALLLSHRDTACGSPVRGRR